MWRSQDSYWDLALIAGRRQRIAVGPDRGSSTNGRGWAPQRSRPPQRSSCNASPVPSPCLWSGGPDASPSTSTNRVRRQHARPPHSLSWEIRTAATPQPTTSLGAPLVGAIRCFTWNIPEPPFSRAPRVCQDLLHRHSRHVPRGTLDSSVPSSSGRSRPSRQGRLEHHEPIRALILWKADGLRSTQLVQHGRPGPQLRAEVPCCR